MPVGEQEKPGILDAPGRQDVVLSLGPKGRSPGLHTSSLETVAADGGVRTSVTVAWVTTVTFRASRSSFW
jgi:hypothetical protein